MYIALTPWNLADGTKFQATLILPSDHNPGRDFFVVGDLVLREADDMVVGYAFDLLTDTISATKAPNPQAGEEHHFCAWRLSGASTDPVSLRPVDSAKSRGKRS